MSENTNYHNIIHNLNDALNVVVNFYIIRAVYKNMGKKNRNNHDMGYLYDNILNIEKNKYSRICKGENFEFSKYEGEVIANKFKISSDYFIPGGRIIEIHELEDKDWQYFIYDTLNNTIKIEGSPSKEKIKTSSNKVENIISRLAKDYTIEKRYTGDETLYKLFYFFKHETAYEGDTRFGRFTKELLNMRFVDWDLIINDIKEMEVYQKLLSDHCNYLQSVITVKKYRNKK